MTSIMHVTAPARVGGLESVVMSLAAGQKARGHQVAVVAVVDADSQAFHPFLDGLRMRGIDVVPLAFPPRAYLRERAAIREEIERRRPDVVHTHGYHADVIAGPLSRVLRVPVVTTVHGFTGGGWKNRLYEALQVRSYRRFEAVVAVSEPLEHSLAGRGVPRDRLRRIPNRWLPAANFLSPADARAELSIDRERFRLGWVGRLSHEKGADLFLDALAQVSDLPWSASILGDGRLRASLEARAHELGIGERIDWHGAVTDAARLMRAFDVLMLTSRTEGTPIVLLEAMAAGVPIIATRVGGVPSLVGSSAELVEPSSEALANMLRSVHGNSPRRAELAASAERRLEEWTTSGDWIEDYDNVYVAAAGRRTSSPR